MATTQVTLQLLVIDEVEQYPIVHIVMDNGRVDSLYTNRKAAEDRVKVWGSKGWYLTALPILEESDE